MPVIAYSGRALEELLDLAKARMPPMRATGTPAPKSGFVFSAGSTEGSGCAGPWVIVAVELAMMDGGSRPWDSSAYSVGAAVVTFALNLTARENPAVFGSAGIGSAGIGNGSPISG